MCLRKHRLIQSTETSLVDCIASSIIINYWANFLSANNCKEWLVEGIIYQLVGQQKRLAEKWRKGIAYRIFAYKTYEGLISSQRKRGAT